MAQRRVLLHVILIKGPQLEGAQDGGCKRHGDSQACETFGWNDTILTQTYCAKQA